jgi:mannose-1-phosphate guanylyltransferase
VDIDAVLFAAGRGERLRPLSDRIPKPAVPILDVPVGAWGLYGLLAVSERAAINVSHLPEAALAALAPYAEEGDLEVLLEPEEPFGTAGTLRALEGRLADDVAVWNGDLLAAVDVGALRELHRSSGRPATLAVRRVERGADLVIEGHRAVAFIDRRTEPEAAGVQFLGVAVIGREVRALIPADGAQGLGGAVIQPLAEAGELSVMIHDGYTIDVGTPHRYLQANLDVLAGRAPPPPHPPRGTVVTAGSGSAYLGPGASAERSSLGPGAIVLAGAVVEPSGHIERSVVWPGLPATGTVVDSIWCDGAIDARENQATD